jgi:hypothetical protein
MISVYLTLFLNFRIFNDITLKISIKKQMELYPKELLMPHSAD